MGSEPTIGIDLGTTNSVAATVSANGSFDSTTMLMARKSGANSAMRGSIDAIMDNVHIAPE